jgi:hypothetical protein
MHPPRAHHGERPQRFRRHRPIESVLTELGGNGLFSPEGAAWPPQRRISISLAMDPARIREVLAFTLVPSAMPVRLVPRERLG